MKGQSDGGVLPTKRWPGLRAHVALPDGTLYASRGYTLVHSRDWGASWITGPSIQPPFVESLVCSGNMGRRLLRGGIHGLAVTDDGSLVVIGRKSIYHSAPDEELMHRVFRVSRGSRPLSLCHVPGGLICFGEYFGNPNRAAVHIFGSLDNGRTFEPLYTLPPQSVRHIHGLFYDPYRQGIWVLTGDEENESRFLLASEDLKYVEVMLQQGQISRAVSVIVTAEGLYYGTDTPLEQNYVCFFEVATGTVHRLGQLPSSCFTSCRLGNTCFFECVAEPSQTNEERQVSIWSLTTDGRLHLHSQWERDRWPVIPFQFGRMALIQGSPSSRYLFATGTAVKAVDNTLLRWDLNGLYD